MASAPIRHVLIAGGGIVGWSAAAALRKRIPALAVTVVPLAPPEDALADRMQCALPSIVNFHDDIGLTEADTIVRAGSGFRLGSRFEGWAGGLPPYVHAYGEYGRPFGTASFHQHWVRAAAAGGAAPFDAHAPAAALARAGRFAHPQGEPGSPLAAFAYGLTLTPDRYHRLMRAYALHLGAVEREGEIARVRLAADSGAIEALDMADGAALEADLFVDATGPRALLRSALGLRLESWRQWLPCDRISVRENLAVGEPPVLDTVTAEVDGWRWRSASPVLASEGRLSSSAHGDGDGVAIEQGRVSQPWRANCLAIGDAAVRVEPLEWANLHLAHSAIDRLVAMIPDRAFSPVELWDYNRQAATEADRVRDFLALHYFASDRSEPFWRDAAAAEPPPSLAHTLSLFRERGRLPFYEEETFGRDSWLAVLLGQGVMPRAAHPLIDAVPPHESAAAMAALRSGIQAMLPNVPTHSATLQNLMRQAAR